MPADGKIPVSDLISDLITSMTSFPNKTILVLPSRVCVSANLSLSLIAAVISLLYDRITFFKHYLFFSNSKFPAARIFVMPFVIFPSKFIS